MSRLWIPSLWSGPGAPHAYVRRTRGGTFDPTTVTGCKMWLKADALSLSDNDPVSTFTDFSGLGNSPTGVLTARPLWKATSGPNGLPTVRFDGTDDVMTGVAISNLLTASAWSIFAVFSAVGIGVAGTTAYELDPVCADNGGFWGLHLAQTPVAYVFNWDGGEKKTSATITTGTPYLIAGRLDSGNLYASVNGGSDSSVASGNLSTLTGLFQLGKNYSTAFAQIDLAELLVYNVAVGSTDRTAIKDYLNTKYVLY